MVMVTTNPQVVRKVVSVQYHGRNDDDPSDIMAFDENIVANYITSLLYKFLQFDSNFNIMLVFAHSYDIQPFREKYLKEFNTTVMGCQDREDAWSSYRERQSNILLTYKMAMLDACLYTDMVIFVDYLPNLDDYSLVVHSLKDGCGFCYVVFDPETVEVDDNNISLYQENDLEGQLKKYISILDSKSDPLQLDPDMQMLLSMLEMEENAMYNRNYYDAVTY